MPEYTVEFYGKDSNEVLGAASTSGNNDIALCIPRMMSRADKSNISFEKVFAECMAHEIIHSVLRQNVSYEAYSRFDRICSGKQLSILGCIDFKLWHGGMPW